jgi:hypothetical protein
VSSGNYRESSRQLGLRNREAIGFHVLNFLQPLMESWVIEADQRGRSVHTAEVHGGRARVIVAPIANSQEFALQVLIALHGAPEKELPLDRDVFPGPAEATFAGRGVAERALAGFAPTHPALSVPSIG